MTCFVSILDHPELLADVGTPKSWPALTPNDIAEHAPDLSLVVYDVDDAHTLTARAGQSTALARCSLWWNATPQLNGQRIGAIGHFAASNEYAAVALLNEACAHLERNGCALAVGPMDGNTWRKYRFVVDAGTDAPFLMEPTNPPEWPEHFAAAGFATLAHYTSGINNDLSVRDERVHDLRERFAQRSVLMRDVKLSEFETELQGIYRVAEVAFTSNYLYTPISEQQFTAQYRASRAAVVPELVTIAEHEGRTVGFCFCIPDLLEQARGAPMQTAILKTVAILPDRTLYGGLGSLMIDRTHQVAAQLGFKRVIHALMHDSNQSRQISARTGTTMRRYALFSRTLGAQPA